VLENAASYIGDQYKDIKVVKVTVRITFRSGVLSYPSIQEYSRTLGPGNKLFLHYECVNPNCTGFGFDLSYVIRDALHSRKCVEGRMACSGKEDWKYQNSLGCSCDTVLEYKIEPEFLERPVSE
jgi:hypothetical protein